VENNLIDIIENLEEAIITKTKNGIGFCNKLGFKILNDIYKHESNDTKNRLDNNSFFNVEDDGKGPKSKFLQTFEKKSLRAKILKLH
jgi:hypothetical protein